jgi:Dolichyl-phosphate-mannose-protein mannosyltransferase
VELVSRKKPGRTPGRTLDRTPDRAPEMSGVPLPPQVPGAWESRLRPFLERHSLVLALCLLTIAAVRIIATYSVFSNTADEPTTLGCGLQYLGQHIYRYEPQHPPLARVAAALLPYMLAGARPLSMPDMGDDARTTIFRSGNPSQMLMLMRIGILPFYLLAALATYFWARHHFGGVVGVFAMALFSLLPPVLAHGGLATLDMALTGCLGAAFLTLMLWAEKPTWQRGVWFGICTGLAAVSRFTALGYLPACAALTLLVWFAVERPGSGKLIGLVRERAATFGIAVAAGALTIWAVYSFSFGQVPGWRWQVRLPAPEFFLGAGQSLSNSQTGHSAFLLGQHGTRGWWYYFPVDLSVKTPIAFLLLLGFGAWLCWKRRASVRYLIPLAFSAGILAPAMNGHVNIGVRHILPIYIGFSVIAAVGLLQLAEWADTRKWAGAAAALLVLWLAGSGAIHHPDYLAYFNEFAGGHPENIIVDSDYDWMQDTKRLAERMRELGVKEVNYGWTGDNQALWPEMPATKKIHPLEPAEGWTAVSPTIDKLVQYGLGYRYPNLKPWFDYLQPTERAGTLFLYYIPPGSLPRKP